MKLEIRSIQFLNDKFSNFYNIRLETINSRFDTNAYQTTIKLDPIDSYRTRSLASSLPLSYIIF